MSSNCVLIIKESATHDVLRHLQEQIDKYDILTTTVDEDQFALFVEVIEKQNLIRQQLQLSPEEKENKQQLLF